MGMNDLAARARGRRRAKDKSSGGTKHLCPELLRRSREHPEEANSLRKVLKIMLVLNYAIRVLNNTQLSHPAKREFLGSSPATQRKT